MSLLARSPDDRALGRPRPRGSAGNSRRNQPRIHGCFRHPRPQDRLVPFAASGNVAATRNPERNREDRPLMKPTLFRRAVAEFTGTLLLLAAVVGSGIMA